MPEPNHKYLAGLVARFKQRDAGAFAELYALTCNKVYNYARQYLKDEYLAQDALQEVYMAAFRNIDKLSDPALFTAWLNRISLHVCYDICQKQYSRQELPGQELLELVRDRRPGCDPEATVLRDDELGRLRRAMEDLPFRYRQGSYCLYSPGRQNHRPVQVLPDCGLLCPPPPGTGAAHRADCGHR